MRTRSFSPTPVTALEERAVPAAVIGGGFFNFALPYIQTFGVSPRALNFTSYTYNQIESNIGAVANAIVRNQNNPNVVTSLVNNFTARVPYGQLVTGQTTLASILLTDLQTLKAGGVFNPTAATAQVNSLFQTILGRAPTAAEATTASTAIQNGATVKQVATNLLTSPEYLATNTSNANLPGGTVAAGQTQYITSLYRTVLGRAPEAGIVNDWLTRLNNGTITTAGVATTFLNSAEAANSPTSILQMTPGGVFTGGTYSFGALNPNGTIPGPYANTTAQGQVANVLHEDLLNFLNVNEGTRFNVLKSQVTYNTDYYLTFNGRVR